MRAMALTGLRQFDFIEKEKSAISNETDALIRITHVGICGSDIHYFLEGGIGGQIVDYPFVIGHECSGIVEEVGRKVTSVKPGDPVALEPAVSCYDCDQCNAGRPHTCRNLVFMGAPGQKSGALADYVILPEINCYPVPREISLAGACLVEPLSIGCYATQLAGKIKDKTLGILGTGPIGLGTLFSVLDKNPTNIYSTDKLDFRNDIARETGAVYSGNPETVDIVKEIRTEVPEGLDVVFECCGQQEALDQGIRLLKPGGSLVIVGIPSEHRISFDVSALRRKEITIVNVRRQNHCMKPAIQLLKQYPEIESRLHTHTFPVAETNQAFDLVANYQDGVVKAMIALGDS
ncbi:MAG: alcohol dehydrogenase catalytic domain-containing protein [Candidatus Marinimicrobia bacterium]|nr:alcohol dehydrogenase catalytic domain-containing protein [Candidatus Neomarinimicrobiota bacterium]MCF7827868.1 alcohol dehydrogenase catalytic domain-containing protein [Candidatus Neomarinimicrobiota bacterium]MCF7879377.1 alcohol dehydrogenase catalytic domain-containing protein [Candidatus Neomarinimicrobiota bacterium]